MRDGSCPQKVLPAGFQEQLTAKAITLLALSQKEPKATKEAANHEIGSLPPAFSEDLGVGSAVALAKAISMKPKKEKK